jgi:hypothetical protein
MGSWAIPGCEVDIGHRPEEPEPGNTGGGKLYLSTNEKIKKSRILFSN